jgi:hypothetical protein
MNLQCRAGLGRGCPPAALVGDGWVPGKCVLLFSISCWVRLIIFDIFSGSFQISRDFRKRGSGESKFSGLGIDSFITIPIMHTLGVGRVPAVGTGGESRLFSALFFRG